MHLEITKKLSWEKIIDRIDRNLWLVRRVLYIERIINQLVLRVFETKIEESLYNVT